MAIGHDVAEAKPDEDKPTAETYTQYRPNFEDTAYMVLAALGAIMQRIDALNDTDPNRLRQLSDNLAVSEEETEKLPPEKASAVERLVLSLLVDKLEEA